MGIKHLIIALFVAGSAYSQSLPSGEEKWGVVLEHPNMKDVVVRRNIEYFQNQDRRLRLDIYTPPPQTAVEPQGCVVFFTEMNKDRSWKVYQTWPRLAAAHGLIGIAVDVYKENYLESVKKVFEFINIRANQFKIDTGNVGVYIPSHVPANVINYLIIEETNPRVKAAVMFNSDHSIKGPFRKNLPVLYVTDDQIPYSGNLFSPLWEEVQKSKAPWTLRFGAGMPIFFESFADNDDAKKIIREALYFFRNHLEPLPPRTDVAAEDREMIATLYRADYARAARLFKEWLNKYPDDQYALMKYAMISFIDADYREAEKAYRKVKDLDPVYRIDLVKTLLANNKENEAERELTIAMRSGKVKRSPYPSIALFLYSLGRYRQGVAYYEMASEKDLTGQDFINLARGYARINEKESAFRALEKALENDFDPGDQIKDDIVIDVLRTILSEKIR